jgi:hypothetical protein
MDLKKRIGTVADVATIAATILLSVVLVKVYLLTAPPATRPGQTASILRVGEELNSSDVNWKGNAKRSSLRFPRSVIVAKNARLSIKRCRRRVGA